MKNFRNTIEYYEQNPRLVNRVRINRRCSTIRKDSLALAHTSKLFWQMKDCKETIELMGLIVDSAVKRVHELEKRIEQHKID